MTNRRRTVIGAAVIAALAGAWLAFSPYLAMSGMRDALRARDADRINSYIDYDALRSSLKEQLAASMAIAMSSGSTGAPRLSPEAARQAVAYAGPMIDKMVRPETVAEMLSGRAGAMSPAGGADGLRLDGEDVEYHRTSITTFTVGPRGTRGGLQFAMRGLGWKLVGIIPITR